MNEAVHCQSLSARNISNLCIHWESYVCVVSIIKWKLYMYFTVILRNQEEYHLIDRIRDPERGVGYH